MKQLSKQANGNRIKICVSAAWRLEFAVESSGVEGGGGIHRAQVQDKESCEVQIKEPFAAATLLPPTVPGRTDPAEFCAPPRPSAQNSASSQ